MDITEALNNIIWAAEQAVGLMQEQPDYDEVIGSETFESIKVAEALKPFAEILDTFLDRTAHTK